MNRILGLLAFVAFVATSPGLSGLELAAHLGGWLDLSHARAVHVEPAGHSGHSDHCQLGLVAHEGRIPAPATPRFCSDWDRVATLIPTHLAAPDQDRRPAVFPRAPPV